MLNEEVRNGRYPACADLDSDGRNWRHVKSSRHFAGAETQGTGCVCLEKGCPDLSI